MNLEIANRLLALRREHGYSQEELAYKLGVSRQAVSKTADQPIPGIYRRYPAAA